MSAFPQVGLRNNPSPPDDDGIDTDPVIELLVASPSFQADMEGDGETDVEAYARAAVERALDRRMPLGWLLRLYGVAA